MKVKKLQMTVVLVLSGVLCVSADVLHEDMGITGCSHVDGLEGAEFMYGLDGEEVWYADFKNERGVDPQPSFVDHVGFGEDAYENAVGQVHICRGNLRNAQKAYKDLPLERDPPSTPMVYTKDDVEPGQNNVLICHVSGFYPAPVNFYWTKNGQNVTEGTSVNVPFPNKDGSFDQFCRLQVVPQLGDIYSCSVTHPALDRPLTRFWDVEKTQPSIGPAVFCGLGLTVGLLGVAAGTFFLIKGNECS